MTPPKRTTSAARPGQLDQISESIGEIRAYVHAGRHDVNNLTQIVNAQETAQTKRHAELEGKIEKGMETMRVEIALVAARVSKLEAHKQQQDGQISVWRWLVEKWPFAALAIIISAVVAWANDRLHF